MALAAGAPMGSCDKASTTNTTARPAKIVADMPGFPDFSSRLACVIARQVGSCVSTPYRSSASRTARADLDVAFWRCSSEQKCGSFSLRSGPIFFRQYLQTMFKPTPCSNQHYVQTNYVPKTNSSCTNQDAPV